MSAITKRCPHCRRTVVGRVTTDGRGHHVDEWPVCPCRAAVQKVKEPPAWRKHVDDVRRRACVCQLCDEPTVGKPKVALYCEAHRAERRAAAQRKHRAKVGNKHDVAFRARHRERLRKKARAAYQKNAAERERRNAYKRAWRKLNRDKVRAQKERAALRNFRDPQPGVKRWREQVEAGLRKPKPARRNKNGQRLCVTPYCRQVMEGRAKKCDRCKAREAREARQLLEQVGRAA